MKNIQNNIIKTEPLKDNAFHINNERKSGLETAKRNLQNENAIFKFFSPEEDFVKAQDIWQSVAQQANQKIEQDAKVEIEKTKADIFLTLETATAKNTFASKNLTRVKIEELKPQNYIYEDDSEILKLFEKDSFAKVQIFLDNDKISPDEKKQYISDIRKTIPADALSNSTPYVIVDIDIYNKKVAEYKKSQNTDNEASGLNNTKSVIRIKKPLENKEEQKKETIEGFIDRLIEEEISQQLDKHQKFKYYSKELKSFLINKNKDLIQDALKKLPFAKQDIAQKNEKSSLQTLLETGKIKSDSLIKSQESSSHLSRFKKIKEKALATYQSSTEIESEIKKLSSQKGKVNENLVIEHKIDEDLKREIEDICMAEARQIEWLEAGLHAINHIALRQYDSKYLTTKQKGKLFSVDISDEKIDEISKLITGGSFNKVQETQIKQTINKAKTDGKITNFELLNAIESYLKNTNRDTQDAIKVKLSGKMLSSEQKNVFVGFEEMLDQIIQFDHNNKNWKRAKNIIPFDTGEGKSFLVDNIICKYQDFIGEVKDNKILKQILAGTENQNLTDNEVKKIITDNTKKLYQEIKSQPNQKKINNDIKKITANPLEYAKQYRLFKKGFELVNVNLANKEKLTELSNSQSLGGKIIIIDEAIFIDDYVAKITNLSDKGAKIMIVGATLNYAKTLEDATYKTNKFSNARLLNNYQDELLRLENNELEEVITDVEKTTRTEFLKEQINKLSETLEKDVFYKSALARQRASKDNLQNIKARREATKDRINTSNITSIKENIHDKWADLVITNSGDKGKRTQNIFPDLKLKFGEKSQNIEQLIEIATKTQKLVLANFIENGEHKIAFCKANGKEVTAIKANEIDDLIPKLDTQQMSEAIMIYAGDKEFVVGGDYSKLSALRKDDRQNIFLNSEKQLNIDLIKQMKGRKRGDKTIKEYIICSENVVEKCLTNGEIDKQKFIAQADTKDFELENLQANLARKISKRTGLDIKKLAESLNEDEKQKLISGQLTLNYDKSQINSQTLTQENAKNYITKISYASIDEFDRVKAKIEYENSAFDENNIVSDIKLKNIGNITEASESEQNYKINRDLRSYLFWDSIKTKSFNFRNYTEILETPKDYQLDEKFVKSVLNASKFQQVLQDDKFIELAIKISHCEKTKFAKRRDFLSEIKEKKLEELINEAYQNKNLQDSAKLSREMQEVSKELNTKPQNQSSENVVVAKTAEDRAKEELKKQQEEKFANKPILEFKNKERKFSVTEQNIFEKPESLKPNNASQKTSVKEEEFSIKQGSKDDNFLPPKNKKNTQNSAGDLAEVNTEIVNKIKAEQELIKQQEQEKAKEELKAKQEQKNQQIAKSFVKEKIDSDIENAVKNLVEKITKKEEESANNPTSQQAKTRFLAIKQRLSGIKVSKDDNFLSPKNNNLTKTQNPAGDLAEENKEKENKIKAEEEQKLQQEKVKEERQKQQEELKNQQIAKSFVEKTVNNALKKVVIKSFVEKTAENAVKNVAANTAEEIKKEELQNKSAKIIQTAYKTHQENQKITENKNINQQIATDTNDISKLVNETVSNVIRTAVENIGIKKSFAEKMVEDTIQEAVNKISSQTLENQNQKTKEETQEQQNTEQQKTIKINSATIIKNEEISQNTLETNPEWFNNKKILRSLNKIYEAKPQNMSHDDFVNSFIADLDSITQDPKNTLATINKKLFGDNTKLSLTIGDVSTLDACDDIDRKLNFNSNNNSQNYKRPQLEGFLKAYLQSQQAEDFKNTINTGWTRLVDKEVNIKDLSASVDINASSNNSNDKANNEAEIPSSIIRTVEFQQLLFEIRNKER